MCLCGVCDAGGRFCVFRRGNLVHSQRSSDAKGPKTDFPETVVLFLLVGTSRSSNLEQLAVLNRQASRWAFLSLTSGVYVLLQMKELR